MANTLELNCFVSGDDPDHIFTIKIANTKNVGALKDAIKDKNEHLFQHLDGKTLVIQKVSLPVDESLKENLRNLSGEKLSFPLDKLSKVFSNLDDTNLHIVVGGPPGACKCHSFAVFLPDLLPISHLSVPSDSPLLEINCLVHGEPRSHIFPVQIAATKTVGALKDTVKEKKQPAFDHVPADTLVLWKVSFPVNESLDGTDKLP